VRQIIPAVNVAAQFADPVYTDGLEGRPMQPGCS